MKNNKLDPAKIDPAAIAEVINNPPQPCDRIRRISNVPIPALVAALTDPKQKCGGRNRRVLKAGMEYLILRPQTEGTDPAVKVALKLQKLPLRKLIRRLKQSARRASTAGYILTSLAPNSRFRVGILAEQRHQRAIMKQVEAEIQVRTEVKVTE